jgi:hypothetical protein
MMRERLIELLKSKSCWNNDCPEGGCEKCDYIAVINGDAEHIADYLIANKVTIQSIKVGDIVFLLLEKLTAGYDIIESKCVRIEQTVYGTTYSVAFPCLEIGNTLESDETDIGITVFLSKKEAQEKKKSLVEDWEDEDEG